MQKIKFLIGFLFVVTISSGQSLAISKRLNGKVTADYNDLEGIYIVNLKTERATLTERGGYFSITACPEVLYSSYTTAISQNYQFFIQ